MSATTMKALVFENHKDTPTIATDIPRPMPSDDQVQVKVEYAALDHGFDDVLNNTFTGSFIHKQSKPLMIGWHYAGKVTAIGANIHTFEVGDAVFGHLEHSSKTTAGTLAEYIAVSSSECAHRPVSVEAKAAAAASVEASTALQGLRDHGKLTLNEDRKKPKTVLVIGAAGGVGSAAVQIAVAMGAHVTAVCSAGDVARVKEYGAHVVLSREAYPDPLSAKDTKYDIIFDTPFVLRVTGALGSLAAKGHYVTTMLGWGLLWGLIYSLFTSKSVHVLMVKPRQADLITIANWMAHGELKIPIDSTFKVKDVQQALQRQRERKAGRVTIQVENGWV